MKKVLLVVMGFLSGALFVVAQVWKERRKVGVQI